MANFFLVQDNAPLVKGELMNDLSVREELSIGRILRDGGILSGLFGLYVYVSLAVDPEIWVHDFPPDISEKWGEKSERARKLSAVLAIPLLLIFFGGVLLSNLRLRRANDGRLSFAAAFANAYAVYMVINLFDMAILDWLIFTWWTPAFIVLPGSEGMAGYDDYRFHAVASAKGSVLGLFVALLIALLTASWGRKVTV